MGAIADLSDVINRLTGGGNGTPEFFSFEKDPRVGSISAQTNVIGQYHSLWLYNGAPGGATAIPSAAANPTNATDGALKQTNPGGGRQKWLLGGQCVARLQSASVPGVAILYDRLLHSGGLSGTNTAAQAVTGSLTRYNSVAESVGNQIFIEIYTQIGATPTTAVVNYTNQLGNAATSPEFAIGGTGLNEAQRLIHVPLAAGDTGVQGITSVDLVASTGTIGNFGVTVARKRMEFVIQTAGGGVMQNRLTYPGPVEIKTDACLAWMWIASATIAPALTGILSFVEA